MGMSDVLFFVCMSCHNCFLLPFSPAMFSGCISPCIRPDLNIIHGVCPPCAGLLRQWMYLGSVWVNTFCPCRLLYAMYAVFKCPFTVLRPSTLEALHVYHSVPPGFQMLHDCYNLICDFSRLSHLWCAISGSYSPELSILYARVIRHVGECNSQLATVSRQLKKKHVRALVSHHDSF